MSKFNLWSRKFWLIYLLRSPSVKLGTNGRWFSDTVQKGHTHTLMWFIYLLQPRLIFPTQPHPTHTIRVVLPLRIPIPYHARIILSLSFSPTNSFPCIIAHLFSEKILPFCRKIKKIRQFHFNRTPCLLLLSFQIFVEFSLLKIPFLFSSSISDLVVWPSLLGPDLNPQGRRSRIESKCMGIAAWAEEHVPAARRRRPRVSAMAGARAAAVAEFHQRRLIQWRSWSLFLCRRFSEGEACFCLRHCCIFQGCCCIWVRWALMLSA